MDNDNRSLYKNLKEVSPAETNLEAIRVFVASGGEGTELTTQQRDLKEKIEFADEQIRSKNGFMRREAIANIIRLRFSCSRDTAFRYMRFAEELYCSSNPLNKKYAILLRIEVCEQRASDAAFLGDHKAAAMYESCIAKYMAMYPDASRERMRRKQIFIFPTIAPAATFTKEAAFEIISSHLKNMLPDGN